MKKFMLVLALVAYTVSAYAQHEPSKDADSKTAETKKDAPSAKETYCKGVESQREAGKETQKTMGFDANNVDKPKYAGVVEKVICPPSADKPKTDKPTTEVDKPTVEVDKPAVEVDKPGPVDRPDRPDTH